MDKPEYGSVEYYESMFSDILADLSTDDQAETDIASVNLLIAFELAIKRWIKYHKQSLASYEKLLENYRESKSYV